MLINEYRIVLPLSVEEFQVAHLYSVAKATLKETGGGEGFEIFTNEPFQGREEMGGSGQFTHKLIHLASKVPSILRMLAPKGSLEVHERSWNAYPNTTTMVTNPDYMKENFHIEIKSRHEPDTVPQDNIFNLNAADLQERKVINIDIADSSIVPSADYTEDEDPAKYHSQKTGRGPLDSNWQSTAAPVMCVYKLVKCEFKWWGQQATMESRIMKSQTRIYTKFFRQVFCWADEWYGMTMEEIRKMEEETQTKLDVAMGTGKVVGMTES